VGRRALETKLEMVAQIGDPVPDLVDTTWYSNTDHVSVLPKDEVLLGTRLNRTSGNGYGLFLENPKIPLDTNGVERALRGVAVGRKNHYGSRSDRGTRVAALSYSLIESAKLCGVEVFPGAPIPL
jgi:hypothetical protein